MTFVLGVLAQVFALTIGAAVAVRFVRRAAVRHAIWTAATIGCLVTPLASGYMPNVRVPIPRSLQHVAPAATPATPRGGANVTRTARTRDIDALDGVSLTSTVAASWPVSLAALWLLGTCVLLGRTIVSVYRARRVVQSAGVVRSATLLSGYETVRRDHGLARATLLTTPSLVSAATYGVFRPVVLLPVDAADWSPERVHAVLAHELAHIARRDCLTQLLAQFARAVYWFNPLIWFAERRMAVERERACDDVVLGSGVSATAYAAALVDAVRRARTWQMAVPSPVIAMAGASELETRVRHILQQPSQPFTRLSWFKRVVIATSCTACILLVASVRLGSAQPASVLLPNAREPDLLGDSIASPTSERLVRTVSLDSLSLRAVQAGADSALAAQLVKASHRVPTWEGDLVRERALWALSQARNGELITALIDAFGDGDWRVRAYAAWALGYSRDRRATAPLVEQLEHPVWRLRAMAAHALEMLADPAARSAMIGRLQDPAWQVRSSAVNYVSELRDPALLPLIRASMSDRHVMVRTAAERVLTQDASR